MVKKCMKQLIEETPNEDYGNNTEHVDEEWDAFMNQSKKQSKKMKQKLKQLKNKEKNEEHDENERNIQHWLYIYHNCWNSSKDLVEYNKIAAPRGARGYFLHKALLPTYTFQVCLTTGIYFHTYSPDPSSVPPAFPSVQPRFFKSLPLQDKKGLTGELQCSTRFFKSLPWEIREVSQVELQVPLCSAPDL
eukprot:jgi/Psemu1/16648/gm1.16648_g